MDEYMKLDAEHHVSASWPLTCDQCHRQPPVFGTRLTARAALAKGKPE